MTDNSELLPYVDRLKTARVLCIGDVMLDHYVYGQVERVSPEAPIPVLWIEREMKTLGGAGNVLRNLRALGAAASFILVPKFASNTPFIIPSTRLQRSASVPVMRGATAFAAENK